MMEPAQILLTVVVVVLTIILVAIGIQVYFILKEVRQSVRKMNNILDDAGEISHSVAKPISSLSGSLMGMSGVGGLITWLMSRKGKKASGEEARHE